MHKLNVNSPSYFSRTKIFFSSEGDLMIVCLFGGELMTSGNGSISYEGGSACSIFIHKETTFVKFQSYVLDLFSEGDSKEVTFKYCDRADESKPMFEGILMSLVNEMTWAAFLRLHNGWERTYVYVVKKLNEYVSRGLHISSEQSKNLGKNDDLFLSQNNMDKRLSLTSCWANLIDGIGQKFEDRDMVRDTLQRFAIGCNFIPQYKNNDSRRITVGCADELCQWRLHASKDASTPIFTIKTYNNVHNCGGRIGRPNHPRATQKLMSKLILKKVRDNPFYSATNVVGDSANEFGLKISYIKAWRAKEIARSEIFGDYKTSYNNLPWYINKLKEKNPASTITYTTDEEKRFTGVFICYRASQIGFEEYCRPLIFLDGCHLTGNAKDTLLVAKGVDGGNGIFPLAFAIVLSENEKSWTWFLQMLKSVVSNRRKITFVSDKDNGLLSSISTVFPLSYHVYCLRHLEQNFKDASPQAHQWVLNNKPEHWAIAKFHGEMYEHMTSNIVESFNSWILSLRGLPLLGLLDGLRVQIMKMMYKRREESAKWSTYLVPTINDILRETCTRAQGLTIAFASKVEAEVMDTRTEIVHIGEKTCTCGKWQLSGLPCIHVAATLAALGENACDFVQGFYFTTSSYNLAYAGIIHPIPEFPKKMNIFEVPVEVFPPLTHVPRGRSKKKRIESQSQSQPTRIMHCSKCGQAGHNRSSCKRETDGMS